MKTLAAFLLLASLAFAQEPVGGPIVDAIEKRFTEKIEAQSKLIEALERRLEARSESRLAEVRKSIADLVEDRQGVLAAVREFQSQREGLLVRIRDFNEELIGWSTKWTPLQNLVDRLTSLLWKLIWFVCILTGFIAIVGICALFAYLRLKGAIKEALLGNFTK